MDTIDVVKQVADFRPTCEQETADRELILTLAGAFGDNLLTRGNPACHFTASGFIVNKDLTKLLMVHHNIYNSWSWTGGHADGDGDLLAVARREAQEETGISDLRLLGEGIATVDVLPVIAHVKRGRYVSAHLHLTATYLFVGDEEAALDVKPDENSAVAWLPVAKLNDYVSEAHMLPIYEKLIAKARGILL